MTPTARTLKRLRASGWTAAVVEKFNHHARVRQDLFGCIDVLAIRPSCRILGVQCTTATNAAARLQKALALPALKIWLLAGGLFSVWAWAKLGLRGRRKLWRLTQRDVMLERGDLVVSEPFKDGLI